MLTSDYFESLAAELDALKNRVRNFTHNRHWQTDGEWKESVLRAFLRRNLPKSVQVGRGFIITEREISKQIDILIYDGTKPLLFQDGDLVFAPPDAVLGVLEVKTSLDRTGFRHAIDDLCKKSELVGTWHPTRRVVGLFSYEDRTGDVRGILPALRDVVNSHADRIINLVCLGPSRFIRYWNLDPTGKKLIDKWHAYELENKAPGYFIHNVIEGICPY